MAEQMFEHLMTQRMRQVWNLPYLEKVRELEAFRHPGGRDGATRPDLPATPRVRETHQRRGMFARRVIHRDEKSSLADRRAKGPIYLHFLGPICDSPPPRR